MHEGQSNRSAEDEADSIRKASPHLSPATLATLAQLEGAAKGANKSLTPLAARVGNKPSRLSPIAFAIDDVDVERLEQVRAGCRSVITMRTETRQLARSKRDELAHRLADKLIYVLPTYVVAKALRTGRRGPKPKLAEVHLLNDVRAALEASGVKARDWRGGQGEAGDLRDWCEALLAATGVLGLTGGQGRVLQLSGRQRQNASRLRKTSGRNSEGD